MSNIVNRPPSDSGLYHAPSHAEGGVQVIVDGTKKIEVEGDEYSICESLLNSNKKYQFRNKTNLQILESLHKDSCTFEQGKAEGGSGIICKKVIRDKKRRNREGTVREILNQMQTEKSCRVMAQGGKIEFDFGGEVSNSNDSLYYEEIIHSPEFISWFGDWEQAFKKAKLNFKHPAWKEVSKVVDKNGKPLILYHGSPNKFNVFDFKKIKGINEGYGFYFTPNKDIAQGYHESQNGKLFAVFLNFKNPYSNDKLTFTKSDVRNVLLALHKKDPDFALSNYGDIESEGLNTVLNQATNLEYESSADDVEFIAGLINAGIGTQENVLTTATEVTGKDGVITEWKGDEISTPIYVAINPIQIKLADGTNTTFDAANPDVRYADGGITSKFGGETDAGKKKSFNEIIHSENFKKWFDGSKVVDAKGNPLILYHASYTNFTVFKTKRGAGSAMASHTMGAYLSTKESEAKRYGTLIRPFFLKASAIADFTDIAEDDKNGKQKAFDYLETKIGIEVKNKQTHIYNNSYFGYTTLEALDLYQQIVPKLKAKGYDAIAFNEGGGITYVCFNSNNIKLADGTNTTFDAANPDVRYIKGGAVVRNIKKVKSFKTEEGRFSVYDVADDVRGRSDMFTVLEDKQGWIVRHAFVPDDLQKQGIATDFYKEMNEQSLEKTNKPLRSTQSRTLLSGEKVHELSTDGVKLWDSFVRKGYADKLSEKNYVFKNEHFVKGGTTHSAIEHIFKPVNAFSKGGGVESLQTGKSLINKKVYHGTPDKRFSEIKNPLMGQNSDEITAGNKGVIWFTDNYYTARSYADPHLAWDYQNAEPAVLTRYITINNPLVVDAGHKVWRNAEFVFDDEKVVGTRQLVEYAKKKGHDGIVVNNVYDNYNHFKGEDTNKKYLANTYGVFSDKQVGITMFAKGGNVTESDAIVKVSDKKLLGTVTDINMIVNADYVNDIFKKAGINMTVTKYLGHGVFGTAFLTSKDTVVKLVENNSEGYYNIFLQKLQAKKDFKTQAKILAVYYVTDGIRHFFVIEKEKVKVLQDIAALLDEKIQGQSSDIIYTIPEYIITSVIDSAEHGFPKISAKYWSKDTLRDISKNWDKMFEDEPKIGDAEIKELQKIIDDVIAFEENVENEQKQLGEVYFADVHTGNIGYSGNKIVCFDCTGKGKTFEEGGAVMKTIEPQDAAQSKKEKVNQFLILYPPEVLINEYRHGKGTTTSQRLTSELYNKKEEYGIAEIEVVEWWRDYIINYWGEDGNIIHSVSIFQSN